MIKEMSIGTKITLAGFILTLICIFAGIVSANARAQDMIEQNKASIFDCKESITHIENNVAELNIDIATVQTHYIHIKESLDRIEAKLEN